MDLDRTPKRLHFLKKKQPSPYILNPPKSCQGETNSIPNFVFQALKGDQGHIKERKTTGPKGYGGMEGTLVPLGRALSFSRHRDGQVPWTAWVSV